MINYTNKLFSLAQGDLKSSYILYDYRLYSQSIYMFQQAVEKGVKYYGLLLDIVTVNDLKNIGHQPIKLYNKILRKHKEIFKALHPISQDKNIGRSELFRLINTNENIKAINESEREIQKLLNKNVHNDKYLIIDIYNKILETNDIRTKIRKSSKTNEIIKNALLDSVKMFSEFSSRAVPFNAYNVSIGLDYLLRNNKQKDNLLEIIPKIIDINLQIIKINQLLLLFSILVMKLDDRLRYPANVNQTKLFDSYNKKDSFIKMLPEFQKELSLVFKELKKVTSLIHMMKK